jgi:hypothetical protein
MATRAERFRAEQERTHPKAAPAPRKRAAAPTKVDKKVRLDRAVSGTVLGKGRVGTGLRNLNQGKRAAYALEDTAVGEAPSRKSTRRSPGNGVKAGTALTSRQKLKAGAPAVRHERRT